MIVNLSLIVATFCQENLPTIWGEVYNAGRKCYQKKWTSIIDMTFKGKLKQIFKLKVRGVEFVESQHIYKA